MKYFCEIKSKYARALQIWQVLIGLASNRQIITNGLLGQIIEVESVRTIGTYLDPVKRYCSKNGLPPLTILVVNIAKGPAGKGSTTAHNENLDRENVFDYDWYDLYPPSEKDFEKLY